MVKLDFDVTWFLFEKYVLERKKIKYKLKVSGIF